MPKRVSHLWAIAIAVTLSITATAQSNPAPACPTLTVTGPAGIPNPGDFISYIVQLTGNIPANVGFKWSVSSGKVVEGQGTDQVKIDADWMSGVSITATVDVLGLPEGCPTTSSETMAVSVDNFDPVLTDQYSTQVGRVENTRLIAYAAEMNKHPNSFAYILEYFLPRTKKTAIEKKVAMTRAALVKAGLAANNFRIVVVTDADQNLTKLYRVPPGANNPTP
jgi:hypothetical protein